MILAPIARGRKGEYKKELEQIAKGVFGRGLTALLTPLTIQSSWISARITRLKW